MNIEQEYQRLIDAMTPAERVARGAAMFEMARHAIGERLVKERGSMPDEERKWRVAMEQYGTNDVMRGIIQEQLDRVPR